MKLKFIPTMTLVATMLLSSTVFGATGKVINGRTMIPLRGSFEELGFSVSWDSTTNSATLKDSNHTMVVTQNSTSYTVDGTKYTSDVAPQVINGSMYIPLRTLGDKIGAYTEWNNNTQTTTIKYNGKISTITTNSGSSSSTNANNTTSISNSKIKSTILDTIDVISQITTLYTDAMNNAISNPTYSEACIITATAICERLYDLDYTPISSSLEKNINSYSLNMQLCLNSLHLSIVSMDMGDYVDANKYVNDMQKYYNYVLDDVITFETLTTPYFK